MTKRDTIVIKKNTVYTCYRCGRKVIGIPPKEGNDECITCYEQKNKDLGGGK